MHRRQSRGQRQGIDANAVCVHERIDRDIKCIRAAPERVEGGRDVLRSPDFGCGDLKAEGAGRCLGLAHLQH
jgi:hypothetical protein